MFLTPDLLAKDLLIYNLDYLYRYVLLIYFDAGSAHKLIGEQEWYGCC